MKYLTPKEALEYFPHIKSQARIRKWIHAGKFPGSKVIKHDEDDPRTWRYLIPEDEITKIIQDV